MKAEQFYHIYNRGNNRQRIFLKRDNYLYFLKKIRTHLITHVHILAYCLMPNHFHVLAYSKADVVPEEFSNDLRVMIRSYTRGINNQENRSGSLFQQNTKVKALNATTHGMTLSHAMSRKNEEDYLFTCFHYIHQNPMKAGLVKRMEDWEMSSFRNYAGLRDGSLCNKQLAVKLLNIPASSKEFLEQSYAVQVIDEI
jgi:putative transposase